MEQSKVDLSKEGGGGSSGEGFIDRSKVRILVCDNDANSSNEAFHLLCKCSYQVTSVRSPRQVIDALNAEGPDIDIILSEVDLPMSKGLKMLKYIMRDKEWRRIPVIMMSAQDEVSVVVKCLKFGAADYLVKPLRTNELLNLWTHMWRRRRMLGLAEKNILSYDFDLVVSDPSDPNTNSTTLFSDDKSRKSVSPETYFSIQHEVEINAATAAVPVEPLPLDSLECEPNVLGISDQWTGQIASCPEKSKLKIGESSAFFTYVKSSMLKNNPQGVGPLRENALRQLTEKNRSPWGGHLGNDTNGHVNSEPQECQSQGDDFLSSNSIPDSFSVERSCTPPLPLESLQEKNSKVEEFSEVHIDPRNDNCRDVSGFHAQSAYPYYISGMMTQVMMQSSAPMYQNHLQDLQNHSSSVMFPQYNHIPQCSPHMAGMASFPYYPVGICVQPGQMHTTHPWLPYGSPSSAEGNLNKVDRREAALVKFRQKRKDRCFDKKIRYVKRKRLAERRPRVRGQFVRKINGVNVDINGQPASANDDEKEEDEEDEEN